MADCERENWSVDGAEVPGQGRADEAGGLPERVQAGAAELVPEELAGAAELAPVGGAGLVPEEVSREACEAVRRLVELAMEASARLLGQLAHVQRVMARALKTLERPFGLALALAKRLAQSQVHAGSRRALMRPRTGERLRLCRCIGRPRRGFPPLVAPRARRMCGNRHSRRRSF